MDYAIFVYNVTFIVLFTVNCAGFYLFYRRDRNRLYFWIAVMFGLYILDIGVLYMGDFIPGFNIKLLEDLSIVAFFKSELGVFIILTYRLIVSQIFNKPIKVWEITLYAIDFYKIMIYPAFPLHIGDILMLTLYAQTFLWLFKDKSRNISHHSRLINCLVFSAICYLSGVLEEFCFHYPFSPRSLSIEFLSIGYTLFGLLFLHDLILRSTNISTEKHISEKDLILLISDQYGLTLREAEILELLFKGYNNLEICSISCIAMGTVKVHTHNIYQKLGIQSRSQLNSFMNTFIIRDKFTDFPLPNPGSYEKREAIQ